MCCSNNFCLLGLKILPTPTAELGQCIALGPGALLISLVCGRFLFIVLHARFMRIFVVSKDGTAMAPFSFGVVYRAQVVKRNGVTGCQCGIRDELYALSPFVISALTARLAPQVYLTLFASILSFPAGSSSSVLCRAGCSCVEERAWIPAGRGTLFLQCVQPRRGRRFWSLSIPTECCSFASGFSLWTRVIHFIRVQLSARGLHCIKTVVCLTNSYSYSLTK